MAVKPWKGALIAPTGFLKQKDKNHDKAPLVKIDLEWVHGYRGS